MSGKLVVDTHKMSSHTDIFCRLAKEEAGGNWLYSIDQLAPLEI